jgi:L-amino acid N-acyltransferase YncA
VADRSVRPARPQDAARVAELQLATWRAAYAGLLPGSVLDASPEEVAPVWQRAVEQPPSDRHRVLVALEADDVVGLAATAPADPEDGDPATTAELATLLVEPTWGRRGHGSRLLAALVDGWRADGVRRAVAWAWERDTATSGLLTAAGWQPDGAARGLDTGAGVHRQLRLHTSLE